MKMEEPIHSKVRQSKISYGLTNKIPLEDDTGLKYAKDFKTNYSEAYNSMDKNNMFIILWTRIINILWM